MMKDFVISFDKISIADIPVVGGKNASLGEMIKYLSGKGINVPNGFATTANAFWYFVDENNLSGIIRQHLAQLDRINFSNLQEISTQVRNAVLQASMPSDLREAVIERYRELCKPCGKDVAVRSSATAEDLPDASFAGLHESFLNISDEQALLESVQKCFASLYTARAIKYREDKGFDHAKIALSVGVQKMVRSDKGCSGIGFTLEPETGFRDIIHLSGVWGLGENIVQGNVTPDEFFVFKPTLLLGKNAIIQKKLGEKEKTMIYSENGSGAQVLNIDTSATKRNEFVLSDREVLRLAEWAGIIENHYGRPMDIEWAKDGTSNELFIIQARPETVHAGKTGEVIIEYTINDKGKMLAEGQAIGTKLAVGVARVMHSPKEAYLLQPGEILVTDITSPDWDPILKKAAAIVTNKGGRTSHASIVARELGVPAVVGTGRATDAITNGQLITVSCCEGKTGHVYDGKSEYAETQLDFSHIEIPEFVDVMLILGYPGLAFKLASYPSQGVGLLRMEFIITHAIRVHPMALVKFNEIDDVNIKKEIEDITRHYADKAAYFTTQLAQGIATIAAAFYPRDVIVRMSDFKTNEYANLIGGKHFEPSEENPMLGFRGASRYYSDAYKDGFKLECEAVKTVREDMGLTNLKVMIPFCRTVEEAEKVIDIMAEFGLNRKLDLALEIYMMTEIPSNVLLADDFANLFDGFSIGSNDLTQLTLGIDRDSSLVASLFDENNKAAKMMISMAIKKARSKGVKIGICGQAPSDFPEFTQFLVDERIDSISFNPDAFLKGMRNVVEAEQKSLDFY